MDELLPNNISQAIVSTLQDGRNIRTIQLPIGGAKSYELILQADTAMMLAIIAHQLSRMVTKYGN